MWLLPISILIVTTLLAIPLSKYLSWIMDGKYRPWGPFRWIENRLNSGPQTGSNTLAPLLLTLFLCFRLYCSLPSAVAAS
jgi:K+-transporting ATPase ATPase A chain